MKTLIFFVQKRKNIFLKENNQIQGSKKKYQEISRDLPLIPLKWLEPWNPLMQKINASMENICY